MTGGADVDSASYNTATGLFSYANVVPDEANQCINGDCSLPGETTILNSGCQSSVSVFTVDYDAPCDCHASPDVRSLLMPLVQYANFSKIVGGLNGTATMFGNSTSTGSGRNGTATSTSTGKPSPSQVITAGARYVAVPWVAPVLGMLLVAVLCL
jgi:5'-nucleotidase